MYIKTNDTVQVVAGKDKGKTGKVVKIDRAAGKVIVATASPDDDDDKKNN